MATLTVEIDKERDLPELKEVFDRMGLKFELEDDDWSDLPEAAIEAIKAGMEDAEAGRFHSHEYVIDYMEKKLDNLRSKRNG
jgi:predicted transcriptional regulator